MRYEGKIVKWYDDKGFGFIRATEDSKDVFLHISQIQRLKKRPEINEFVSYEITQDEKGRFRATNVVNSMKKIELNKQNNSISLNYLFLIFILLFSAFVMERSMKGYLPYWYPLIYVSANLVVFLYYYQDKRSAVKNDWRTPEAKLHWFSVLGGWGGAYIARKLFRHKHKKKSFIYTYRLTLFVNCLIIILYSVPALRSSF